MRSLSEIETAVKRASRAVGFSWGESEEIGKSIRLLELFGLQGVKSLNQYYKEREGKNFESLSLINKKNEPSSESFCPITLGISFLDQVKSIENIENIQFKNIAHPLIFLSFLSRASEISGKKLALEGSAQINPSASSTVQRLAPASCTDLHKTSNISGRVEGATATERVKRTPRKIYPREGVPAYGAGSPSPGNSGRDQEDKSDSS